jgi:hypothetical protein
MLACGSLLESDTDLSRKDDQKFRKNMFFA